MNSGHKLLASVIYWTARFLLLSIAVGVAVFAIGAARAIWQWLM